MILLTVCAIALFVRLLFGAIRLSFRVTWGLAKAIGLLLCIAAFPILAVAVVTASGLLLLLPLLLIAAACGAFASAA